MIAMKKTSNCEGSPKDVNLVNKADGQYNGNRTADDQGELSHIKFK